MSNTRRVRELGQNARKPRFALGATIVDPWDERGAVTAVYIDLAAAQAAGVVGRGWLAGLAKAPTTPVSAHWYSVLCEGGGEALVGELDLRLASNAKTTTTNKKKTTKKKTAAKKMLSASRRR